MLEFDRKDLFVPMVKTKINMKMKTKYMKVKIIKQNIIYFIRWCIHYYKSGVVVYTPLQEWYSGVYTITRVV